MKGIIAIIVIVVMAAALSIYFMSGTGDNGRGKELVIFHAGSLTLPLKRISEEFNKLHPEVNILSEAAGSVDCARKITELKRPCDVLASADYKVIDQMLIPDFADWNIRFASNEMTIVYHEKSRRSEEITDQNWYEILMDENVAFGRSDPNCDPCGYRAVLTMKLAEKHYDKPGLAEKMLAKDAKFIRPKETDLIALLEAGTIDYIFLYRSVAQQHRLKYLVLPDEVNLKNPEHVELYRSVSVETRGGKSGVIVRKGEPMVYGVTIPRDAKNAEMALQFVNFMLEKENGRKILEEMGQPSVVPDKATGYNELPESLKTFAKKD